MDTKNSFLRLWEKVLVISILVAMMYSSKLFVA